MAKTATQTRTRSIAPLLTPDLIDAQGRADREYLTTQVKLLLDAKKLHPSASFDDLAKLAQCDPCGRGCCCCCGSLNFDSIYPDPVDQVSAVKG